MVSIGYLLGFIKAVVVQGPGLCGLHGLGLAAYGGLVKGRPGHRFRRISNCREAPFVASSLRSGMIWFMAGRSVGSAASRIRHEFTAEKFRKGDPFWCLNASLTVWPNHVGLEGKSRRFGGGRGPFWGPKTGSATGQAHSHPHTLTHAQR